MLLLDAGRDADVYAYGPGLVLRRYRDGRSAEREATIMRSLVGLGYPLPFVYDVNGSDIVMEHIDGGPLALALADGLDAETAGGMLATVQDQLHRVAWPDAPVGQALLHLDLHPFNVLIRDGAPVVIDWSNARCGEPALDTAVTALILAQVVVTDGMLHSLGHSDRRLRHLWREMLASFLEASDALLADKLPEARAMRLADPNTSAAERHRIHAAERLVLSPH